MGNPNKTPWQTLTQMVEDLEREDPAVAKARDDLEKAMWRMSFRHRINCRRQSEGKPSIRGA